MPINPIFTFNPNQIATWHGPIVPLLIKHVGSTFEGTYGNDTFTFHGSDSNTFRDIAYGNGGIDYLRTGGGDDKIFVGDNSGNWRGSGDLIGHATVVDAGVGNDTVTVSAKTGAFQITTGEGQDTVSVRGGDYVQIQAADGDTSRDTFKFADSFHGKAQLYGIDHSDLIDLRGGGHWHQTHIHDDLAFYNDIPTYDAKGNAHHATIEIMGVSASYHDGQPDFIV